MRRKDSRAVARCGLRVVETILSCSLRADHNRLTWEVDLGLTERRWIRDEKANGAASSRVEASEHPEGILLRRAR